MKAGSLVVIANNSAPLRWRAWGPVCCPGAKQILGHFLKANIIFIPCLLWCLVHRRHSNMYPAKWKREMHWGPLSGTPVPQPGSLL